MQQAQNFQHSSSSNPRSRISRMSRGMSQRKVPGGHSKMAAKPSWLEKGKQEPKRIWAGRGAQVRDKKTRDRI